MVRDGDDVCQLEGAGGASRSERNEFGAGAAGEMVEVHANVNSTVLPRTAAPTVWMPSSSGPASVVASIVDLAAATTDSSISETGREDASWIVTMPEA